MPDWPGPPAPPTIVPIRRAGSVAGSLITGISIVRHHGLE
jgi:hypothetical protein